MQKLTLTNAAALQSRDQEIQALKAQLKKKDDDLLASEKRNREVVNAQISLRKECDKLRLCFGLAIQRAKPLAFGPESWEMYIGVVDPAEPLPDSICDTLEANDPWDTAKKVKETHLLFWRPMKINGQPITLQSIETAFKSPKGGGRPHSGYNKTVYLPDDNRQRFINLLNSTWDQVHASPAWVLLRKEAIPESTNKDYSSQSQILGRKKGYGVPSIIEIVFGIFIEHMRGNPAPYASIATRCAPTGLTTSPEVPASEWLVYGNHPLDCFKAPPSHSFINTESIGMGAVIRF